MFKPKNTNFRDISGKTFGKLTAIEPIDRSKQGRIVWLCRCDCGKTINVPIGRLGRYTNSCGCIKGLSNLSHGQTRHDSRSPEYRAYTNAKTRCNNPKSTQYAYYGGRGVEFRFDSFKDFYAEIGKRPSDKHSLDRINVNKHYEKNNIRWAVKEIQNRNKQDMPMLEIDGISKTLAEWAETSTVKKATIWHRLAVAKWCAKCAVNIPVNDSVCQHR